jgi:hypothetical protein
MSKKKSSIKQYKVLTADWSSIVEVDSSIFDDGYVEACTQAIEQKIRFANAPVKIFQSGPHNLFVNPIMVCHNLSNPKEKERYINTYKILQNAGMPKRAENLREVFLKNVEVDLAYEPLSASLKS